MPAPINARLKILSVVAGLASIFLLHGAYAQYDPVIAPENERLAHPSNMVGQLELISGKKEYVGSGTAVSRRGVLTAAHNLYDRQTGFSRNVIFARGRDGDEWEVRSPATRLQILPGYSSVTHATSAQAFGLDIGAIHTARLLTRGTTPAPIHDDPRTLHRSGQKIILGYGAQRNSGKHLLRSIITEPFFTYRGAFLGNEGFEAEAGMSGGPVFVEVNGVLSLSAITVSSGGGVRALDASTRQLLNTLR